MRGEGQKSHCGARPPADFEPRIPAKINSALQIVVVFEIDSSRILKKTDAGREERGYRKARGR